MKKLPIVLTVLVAISLGIFIFHSRNTLFKTTSVKIPGISGANCPTPLIFDMPVDINKVTSVLYPGQYRSGEYKPHGGFRFDSSKNNEITVTAPYDAKVTSGGRYTVEGDLQYTFNFQTSCDLQYRLGHLLTLSPKFAAIAETLPSPKEGDSRTVDINKDVEVKKGEVIATGVGLTKNTNTFLDWGIYDYTQPNEASQNGQWLAKHNFDTATHALCIFDYLSSSDREKLLSLPAADYQSGSQSDYCK